MTDSITAQRYRAEPPPERFNIARACLAQGAATTPDKPALIVSHDAGDARADEIWTCARLEDTVLRTAAVLAGMGVGPGDRVLLRLGNSSSLAVAFLATTAIGAVASPLSALLTAVEIEHMAEDSDARMLIVAPDLPIGRAGDGRLVIEGADLMARARAADAVDYVDTAADDPAYLVFTSGSTARPKGVLHAHRALWGRRPLYADWYGLRPGDVMLHAGALNWTFTLGTGLLDPIANGLTGIVHAGEHAPDTWPKLIDRFAATIFAAVPSVYRQILRHADLGPRAMPTLRHGLAAGEALRPEIAADWRTATGREIHEAFGMSEISTYVSTPPGTVPRPGSPGSPQRGRAVAILPAEGGEAPVSRDETGVIAVHRSDPGLMIGYWNRPDENPFRGDWFVTGDLAAMDADGYLWPSGRADDVMKVLGYRVSAAEVEAVLAAFPGVSEVAAVAFEPRPGLSLIRACVVARDGISIGPDDLRAFAAGHLAAYKVPHEIVLIEALPRTANGKVARARLRDIA